MTIRKDTAAIEKVVSDAGHILPSARLRAALLMACEDDGAAKFCLSASVARELIAEIDVLRRIAELENMSDNSLATAIKALAAAKRYYRYGVWVWISAVIVFLASAVIWA